MAKDDRKEADKEEIQESAVVAERKALELETEDKDLVPAINKAIAESKNLKEEMDKKGAENERYWKGFQLDLKRIPPKRAKIIDNIIFRDIETMIPILTSERAEPVFKGAKISNKLQEKLIKGLEIAYEVKYKMQQTLQYMLRHWLLFRIGIIKYRWDKGFETEAVLPEKIGFDPRATNLYKNCDFWFEYLEDTIENLVRKFPEAKGKLTEKYGKDRMKSKITYVEFWGGGGTWVAWKLGDIILDKTRNPNWDYSNKENNVLRKPRFPYIILNLFKLGRTLYDDTSLIEQVLPLQDAVNKRKNQISNLTESNVRVWVASSVAISKQEFQKFINKTGDVGLWLDRGDPTMINAIAGRIEPSMIADMRHSIDEIDNIIGMHSTTRGERKEQETLGGRQMLMGSDYGRLDMISRNLDQVMEEWYNAYLHLIKIYSTKEVVLEGEEEVIKLTKKDIPAGLRVMVKKGTSLPIDRGTRMDMAKQLVQMDKIAPLDLYEDFGYGEAKEREKRLEEWLIKTGVIQPPPEEEEVPPETPPEGEGTTASQQDQLARIEQTINSPEFKSLPEEEQQQFIQQAKVITEEIKRGG